MRKKLMLGLLSLGLLLTANLHLCRRVSVGGERVEGSFSSSAMDRALTVAALAAEELLPDEAALPARRIRFTLSLSPPEDDTAALADALLRGTEGVCVQDAVYVNGLPLGHVADGAALEEALRARLYGGRPEGAVNGRYTEEIALRTVYTREGSETDESDMLLLVSGLVPALYTDADGRIILG